MAAKGHMQWSLAISGASRKIHMKMSGYVCDLMVNNFKAPRGMKKTIPTRES